MGRISFRMQCPVYSLWLQNQPICHITLVQVTLSASDERHHHVPSVQTAQGVLFCPELCGKVRYFMLQFINLKYKKFPRPITFLAHIGKGIENMGVPGDKHPDTTGVQPFLSCTLCPALS